MLKMVGNPLRAAALAAAVAGCAPGLQPTSRNYRFEALTQEVRPRTDAAVRVRLVRLPEGRPVTGAQINEHRFDMFMSGYKVTTFSMVEGAGPPPVATVEEGNGVYRVHALVPMAGDWTMTLVARVPGEAEPVRGTVRLRAR
jgi:hypothetical protein